MIARLTDTKLLQGFLKDFPVVALLGARQVGKSTLARSLECDHFLDLENPRDLARLDQPQLALERLSGLVAIDEIQRKPELFPLLRYLVDSHPETRYLILGSAGRDLIRQSSESLAGRIAYLELGGFRLEDLGGGAQELRQLWFRGGFPRSTLADSDESSLTWRMQFIQTYLERDIPQLGLRVPAATLGRFWTMLAHYHGQILNHQELSRAFGVSDATVRHYLEILEGTFMIRLLRPWYGNLGKRLVRAPKLYIRDSGLFHALSGIADMAMLESHPKLGASWEGFALEDAIRRLGIRTPLFYRTHTGAELDLVWEQAGKMYGIEFKYADTPRLTPSMRNAMADLSLERLLVVYPGTESWPLDHRIDVVPIQGIWI